MLTRTIFIILAFLLALTLAGMGIVQTYANIH